MAKFEARNGKLHINGKEVTRGFESWNGWYWFATEVARTQDSIINGKVYENDTIYFGFVQGHEEEWGYFSETELRSLAPKVWEIPQKNLPYSGRRREAQASLPSPSKETAKATKEAFLKHADGDEIFGVVHEFKTRYEILTGKTLDILDREIGIVVRQMMEAIR